LARADLEELQQVEDVGPKVAKSIREWFSHKKNLKIVNGLIKLGVKIKNPAPKISQKLVGRTFVLTGELETLTRDEAKDKIRQLGGQVSSSVSKETDLVVTGAQPGSKYNKAKKLGVPIIGEREFLKML